MRIDGALRALQFLTIVPVRTAQEPAPAALARSTRWFVPVGAAVGAAQAGIAVVLAGLNPLARAVFVVAGGIGLTGGLHVDGWADTCDGFGCGRLREAALAVMRDSRCGAFGAAGVAGLVLLKCALLSGFAARQWPAVLLTTAAVARGAQVWCLTGVRYPHRRGAAKAFIGHIRRSDAAIALGTALAVAAGVSRVPGVWAVAAALAAVSVLKVCAGRRFGGVTGDVVGAASELAEVTVLTVLALAQV